MTLVNNLQSTMQAAMKSGDSDRVRTLRTLLAKLKEKSIEKGDDLNDGEEAEFALMLNGKPLAGAEVVLIKEGTRYRNSQDEIKLETNKNGEITVNWQGAGRYFMEAEYKDDKAQAPATQRSATYTAVFEVLPD